MKLLVLDTEFQPFYTVDTFESFIWTDRYDSYGDFELYVGAETELLNTFRPDYYLWLDSSDRLMIIEDITTETDAEDGDHLKITGRSLESILDRRVVWGLTTLSGSFQDAIETLLNQNVISPSIEDRKIENLVFQKSTDTRITSMETETQYHGETLYDAIYEMCHYHGVGFKIICNDDNKFVFSLYLGTDRSYAQVTNDYVVFSPKFDNLLSSEFVESKKTYKNVAYITGEGEGSEQKTTYVGSGSGLDRREIHTDARDVSSKVDDKTLTDAEYIAQLQQKGNDELSENKYTKAFDGEVDYATVFVYGKDYFVGDVVEIVDTYGTEGSVFVSELIHSYSESEIKIYPTFESVE